MTYSIIRGNGGTFKARHADGVTFDHEPSDEATSGEHEGYLWLPLQWFIVTGRVAFDDEDSAHSYHVATRAEAEAEFRREMEEDAAEGR